MHQAAKEWAARWVPDRPVSVLDVGGRNINGTVRHLFQFNRYVSVDLYPGSGVDVVGDFTEYKGEQVDVVVCMEVAEHTPRWPAIIANAARHLPPGGLLIFTAAGPDRAPHSATDGGELTQGEWYRNLEPDDLSDVLRGHFSRHQVDVTGPDIRAVAWR